MSVNSSFNTSLHYVLTNCFQSRLTLLVFTPMLIIDVPILLPPLLYVLYLALQRWRQQCSSATPAVMSHSDFFTYNMAAMDLISLIASGFYCFGAYSDGRSLQWVGNSMFSLTVPGQTLFHLLTCVEHYLAVVHPVTYLSLRQAGGVRIRNISTGCIWLLCLGLVGLTQICNSILFIITYFGIMVFFLVVISYSTFSILCVLKHPGPGEVRGDSERVDQSKQRAFHTVVAIMVALLLRLLGVLVCAATFTSPVLTDTKCAVGSAAMWLTMPGSLVLPLLFLQRAGKLPGYQHKTDSG